jgi:hypothetical protein
MNVVEILFGKDPVTTVTGYISGIVFAWLHTTSPLTEQSTLGQALTYVLALLFALGGRLANEKFAPKGGGPDIGS